MGEFLYSLKKKAKIFCHYERCRTFATNIFVIEDGDEKH